jgi:ferredoxin
MTITVDAGKCIGAGNCVDAAPDYFDQNEDDGTVILLRSEVEPSDSAALDAVEDAVAACPVRAILAVITG